MHNKKCQLKIFKYCNSVFLSSTAVVAIVSDNKTSLRVDNLLFNYYPQPFVSHAVTSP